MENETTYHRESEQREEETLFNSPCEGFALVVLFGEITYANLKYVENNLARLNITISVKLKHNKYQSGFKFYNNRITIWGKEAESIYRDVEVRDDDEKKAGSYIVVLSRRCGGEKIGDNWSHTFSVIKAKIIKDPINYLQQMFDINQDLEILKIESFFE